MKHSVFLATSYREFLTDWLDSQPNGGRGLRSRMAELIGTKTGFITQVFQELAEFSLEQALKIATWIGLNEKEKEFFLTLVQRDRAGDHELAAYLNSQLQRMAEAHRQISQRLSALKVPAELDQATYFSSWMYAAVHVLLTCPGPHTAESIASRFDVPLVTCRKVLEFLTRSGLAIEESGRFKTGEARMHLGTDSPNLLKHHLNWNLRAIQSIEADLTKGVHYSSVVSISKDDAIRIRESLIQAIESAKAIIKKSPGEDLYGLTLNLFAVGTEAH